ncbi:adenosine deaminase/editase [Xylaria intraflava]|nr:adenosine deaminase/editase [Xylaria intraflava]
MTVTPDLIASLVHQEFDKLPAKRKPVIRDNGLHEWVPLSAIVAEGKDGKVTCLSLATGMKCLPVSKLSRAQGNVLHDWHAETLAIRAFNRFVLDECQTLANGSKSLSEFIRWRSSAEMATNRTATVDDDDDGSDGVYWHGQPFTWREDVLLHIYCSEAPCGDASMELTMASQSDATPWATPIPETPGAQETQEVLPGRAYFSKLGIIRRKPARPDAPPTLSKSCSDKLALHQVTSLLSSLSSLLVSPEHAYIATLILPTSQYSAVACTRAFSGEPGSESEDKTIARMAPLVGSREEAGYVFRPFKVQTTELEFRFSRRMTAGTESLASPQAQTPISLSVPLSSPSPSSSSSSSSSSSPKPPSKKITPSPLSTAKTPAHTETTQNGILRGQKPAVPATPRGASFACRRQTWAVALSAATSLDNAAEIRNALSVSTYGAVKDADLLAPRRRVKARARRLALKGWVRNSGDEDFGL